MLIKKSVSLKNQNTFRIGGKAKYYCEPSNEKEIIYCLNWTKEKELPVFIMGKGSNVLISDSGWNGLVINLSKYFYNIIWNKTSAEVLAGSQLNLLCSLAVKRGLTGIEELSGIPGTVGGAVLMNAGAFNTTVSNTVKSVRYCDCNSSEIKEMDNSDIGFGYRTSIFHNSDKVILSALFVFKLEKSARELGKTRLEIIKKRNDKQPVQFPNCGSVFKRPEGNYAGALIEKCGLKGLRKGDVEISQKHANFIINKGNGTASEVRELISEVQRIVFHEYGIVLEPEVIFIGEFEKKIFKFS